MRTSSFKLQKRPQKSNFQVWGSHPQILDFFSFSIFPLEVNFSCFQFKENVRFKIHLNHFRFRNLSAIDCKRLTTKELIVRIKFCQAKTCNKCAKLIKMSSISKTQKVKDCCRFRSLEWKSWLAIRKRQSFEFLRLIISFQMCRMLFTMPKCCKHKSYKSYNFF